MREDGERSARLDRREQERAILRMIYDGEKVTDVVDRERPDFALQIQGNPRPVGVEVTQIFPSEAHARMYLLPGYLQDLWDGGDHRHKADRKILQVERVTVRTKEGQIKSENLPVVMTQTPTEVGRNDALAEALRRKAAACYDDSEFSHINLIVYDWFRLSFDASNYSTEQLFSPEVKEQLRASPFREVFLVTGNTAVDADADGKKRPAWVVLPLRMILLVSEYFLALQGLHKHAPAEAYNDESEAAEVVADYLVNRRAIGRVVAHEKRPLVLLGSAAIGLVPEWHLDMLDYQDFPTDMLVEFETQGALPDELAQRIGEFAESNFFVSGYHVPANEPAAPKA